MNVARPPLWNPEVGFQPSPLLYIGLAFAAGIALATKVSGIPPWIWLIGFSLVLSAALVTLYFHRHRLSLLLALTAVGLGGLLWMLLKEELKPPQHIDRYFQAGFFDRESPVELVGLLASDLERHPDKVVFYLDLEQMSHRRETRRVQGTARLTVYSSLYAPEDFFPQGLYYGDRVRALSRLRPPKNFQNPGAFDFAGYLQANDVHALASAKSPLLVERMDRGTSLSGLRAVQTVRRWMIERFETYLLSDAHSAAARQTAAIVIALVIGERTYLSPEVEENFKRTGTYHVLVISGLHVVALAYVLAWLLRAARVPDGVQVLIIILVLIFFTLLAGARPSILRASVMVSAYLIGSLLYRERRFLNATCFSALVILLINPAWLWDIGFQLTFAAVLTICLVGAPLVDLLVTPCVKGLTSAFSDTVSVETGRSARRMRRARFATELWIERMEARFSLLSRAAWLRGVQVLAGMINHVGGLIVMSVAIQTVMLVLMVNYFHRVTVISPLLNLLVVPLTTAILFIAVLLLPVSIVTAKGAGALAWLVKVLVDFTLACVAAGAHLRFAEYRVPTPPAWVTLGFILTLLAAVSLCRPRARRVALGLFAIFTFLLSAYPFPTPFRLGVLEMTVLDVGQGDTIFLQFPQGRTMLVDAGGLATPGELAEDPDDWGHGLVERFDIGEQVVAPFLWSRGVQRLDYLALTHAHHDHIGGLPFIMEHFSIGALLDGRNPSSETEYARLLQTAQSRRIPVRYLRRGDSFTVDDVAIEILSPAAWEPPEHVSNDDSLTFRLRYGSVSFLLTGDIERRIESELSGWDCAALKADVLKVPHHGSRTSSTDAWVACVDPRLAVISAGVDNPFGHPSADVLNRYSARGVPAYETARHGAITVMTNGHTFSATRWRLHP